MKGFRITSLLLSLMLVMAMVAGNVQAALLDVGPTVPEVIGSSEPNLGHGFPLWYRDTNRVPLQLCTDRASGMCLTAEPNALAPLSFPGNLGDELFWWVGDAEITTIPGAKRALLVQAIEAAFSTGDVASGAQVSFARIRIRFDPLPEPGEYIVTTPFKQFTFNVQAGALEINHTEDIGIAEGGIFTGVLHGSVGPFLYCKSAAQRPAGFIGNPNVPCEVEGSTFPSAQNPSNFFRIQGPNGFDHSTTLFSVSGKLYTDPIPTPLAVDKVSYSRQPSGVRLNAFATTDALSNQTVPGATFPGNFALTGAPSVLQVSGSGIPTLAPATNAPADGKFFAVSELFADPGILPATVSVTNTTDVPQTVKEAQLVDEVVVDSAVFDPAQNKLFISGSSHDSVGPPVLTAYMPGMEAPLGTLAGGQLAVSFPFTDSAANPAKTHNIPPAQVTVRSSKGGSDTRPVSVYEIAVAPASISVPATNATGSYTVSWAASTTVGATYTLEESTSPAFTVGTTTVLTSGLSATSFPVTGKASGTYYYRVKTVKAPSESGWISASVVVKIPVQSVSFTVSPASPQVVGAAVTVTAAGVNDGPAIEYQLWIYDYNGVTPAWRLVRDWQQDPALAWDTALASGAGKYNIQVRARNVGATVPYEARLTGVFYYLTNTAPVTAVSVTTSVPSPQVVGALVDVTAVPTGGGGAVEYQLWAYDINGATPTWRLVRDWQQNATLRWDTAQASGGGLYTLQVRARSIGSTATYEARVNMSYTLTNDPPVSAVAVAASLPSPQQVGTPINFVATPTGGGASIEYQLWVYDYNGIAPAWRMVRDWQQNPTLGWDTAQASGAGKYSIQVRARSVGSTVLYEARSNVAFDLIADPLVTAVSVSAAPASPQTVGAQVGFIATPTGGGANIEYQLWVYDFNGVTPTWRLMRDWQQNPLLVWDTAQASGAGKYSIQVRARNVGSPVAYEARISGVIYNLTP